MIVIYKRQFFLSNARRLSKQVFQKLGSRKLGGNSDTFMQPADKPVTLPVVQVCNCRFRKKLNNLVLANHETNNFYIFQRALRALDEL